MEVQQQQISEGFPVDGRLFEPPEINRDNEHVRFLAFMGSTIEPDAARSRPWTKTGGIEMANPCLRVVKNFLRKGRITPLLKDTHDFLPFDFVKKTTEINPLQAGYFAQPIPRNYVPPNLPPGNGQFQPGFGNLAVGGPSPYGNHVGKLALPGEQIQAILLSPEAMAMGNIPRGVVELVSLRGYDYRPQPFSDGTYVDPAIREMNLTLFPTYPILPVLLDDIEKLLDAAAEHTMLRATVDEMQVSFNQFRDYANATIQNTHYQMKESGGRGGYIWRYTAMDLVLLEQLGMQRQDREIRESAKSGDSELRDIMKQFLQLSLEEKQALADRAKRLEKAPEINEQTMMADQITQAAIMVELEVGDPGQTGTSGYSGASGGIASATPEQIEAVMAESTFTCDACGKKFPAAQGLQMHKSRWCEKTKR